MPENNLIKDNNASEKKPSLARELFNSYVLSDGNLQLKEDMPETVKTAINFLNANIVKNDTVDHSWLSEENDDGLADSNIFNETVEDDSSNNVIIEDEDSDENFDDIGLI